MLPVQGELMLLAGFGIHLDLVDGNLQSCGLVPAKVCGFEVGDTPRTDNLFVRQLPQTLACLHERALGRIRPVHEEQVQVLNTQAPKGTGKGGADAHYVLRAATGRCLRLWQALRYGA